MASSTGGVDKAGVLPVEDVERFLDLEDVSFSEPWPFVGLGVELGLGGLAPLGAAHCSE